MQKNKFFERLIVPTFIAGLFFLGVSLSKPEPINQIQGLSVTYLDVGQGDATLIKTPINRYVLVDGGPNKSIVDRLGVEMPPSAKEFEAIILTHPHADHVAGLNYILDRYKVNKVYMTGVPYTSSEYQAFLERLTKYNIPVEKYYAGKNIYIDELKFSAFYPPQDQLNYRFSDINDSSIVFDLTYKQNSFLYLSDLSAKKQEEMAKINILGHSEVIKVSHHGSASGTSTKLLEIVKPTYAVISVGADNRYGLPAQKTISQLITQQILRTDERGSIKFTSDGNVVTLLP
jgi:competence protein ComEC